MAFRHIALGTAAMSSVGIFRLLAQFFVVPILSRLLSPSDYGIVAMAMPLVIFMINFTDVGVGQSLVRTAQNEKDVWSTSFWLTVFSGCGLAMAVMALSPLAASFFHEPHLQMILMVLALAIIPQAAATIPEASLRQSHRFGTIAAVEMAAVLSGILLAVDIAMKGGGAWALVAQQLGLYGVRFLLTFMFSSFRPHFRFHLSSIKEHLIFGRDLLGGKFIWFLTISMDGIIVGRVLGAMILGFYTMAFTFVRLPVQLITGPFLYVIYAHLAPFRDNKVMLRQAFLFFTRILAIVIFPGMVMLAVAYHPVFKLFLSEKWLNSGELFMLATPAAALQSVTALRSTLMMVLGRTKLQLRSSIEFFLLLAATLLMAIWFGIHWFVVGYSCAVFFYFPRSLMFVLPQLECSLKTYVGSLILPVIVAALSALLYYEMTQSLPLSDWPQLFLGGGLGVLGMMISAFLQRHSLLREISLLQLHWFKEGQGQKT